MLNTHLGRDDQLTQDIGEARGLLLAAGVTPPSWLSVNNAEQRAQSAQDDVMIERALRNSLAVVKAIRQSAALNHVGSTKIEPVVPNVPVLDMATYLTRENTPVIIREGKVTLPLVNHRCIACGHLVDRNNPTGRCTKVCRERNQ